MTARRGAAGQPTTRTARARGTVARGAVARGAGVNGTVARGTGATGTVARGTRNGRWAMPRIGVTGHVTLAVGTADLVYACLAEQLKLYAGPELHGVTCLADGADQLFARAILALSGTYEVVLPAVDYRSRAVQRHNLDSFDELLSGASGVTYMPFAHSGREAYMAASRELLRRCDQLLAVWDGTPSTRLGDTADVVRTARASGVPVTVLWPAGATRLAPPPG